MNAINTVIFDLDGTLLDTLADLADAVNYALSSMGYPMRTYAEVRTFVGNGVANLMRRSVPSAASDADAERALFIFRPYYAAHNRVKTAAYDGIHDMLDALLRDGYRLAVVTNKFEAAARSLVDDIFGERISVVIGESEATGRKKKPAPDGVFEAMRRLGAEPSECVYVGDSDVDIETATNASIPCIGCSWGFRGRQNLIARGLSAEMVIDAPMEILSLLAEINR